ncbi:MAG: FAD-dependent oxidoreductase [Frankiales bacterium]|nr:FAD-dependent oxidoreductase [Frankiales bacterium]
MARGRRAPDLVVVGGGTAGIVAAATAAALGAEVVLVEQQRTGGDCLWTGCVPSKALLAAAAAAAHARGAAPLGIDAAVTVRFADVMQHVRAAIATIEPDDAPAALERAGVRVVHGRARFTGPCDVAVGDETLPFERAVLATGARPTIPSLPGLADVDPLTSDTLWELDALPPRLVVLGGGGIGCELGQAFARLGSDVTVIESLLRLLPREDPDASALVTAALRRDGVRVLTGHAVTAVTGSPAGGDVIVGGSEHVPFDRILVAVGRTPATSGLDLDRALIRCDARGNVVVDRHLRTSNARIWAAGDLTGHPQLTHVAGVHGGIAATNAVLGLRRAVTGRAVPRVTFTDPEVAAVGAGADDPGVRSVTRLHDHVDRAVADGRTAGFARLHLDARNRIVGATVVGPRAGESLAELTLAVRLGLRARDLAATTHPYPTYGDGPWNAAIDVVRAGLAAPAASRAVRTLLAARRALTR